ARIQPRNGREHAECISGQKEYVLGNAADGRGSRVIYKVNGVGRTGVDGHLTVGIINFTGTLMKPYILHNRTKAHRIPDIRLIFLGKVNDLGITASFEIEYTVFGPAMFIISDQF